MIGGGARGPLLAIALAALAACSSAPPKSDPPPQAGSSAGTGGQRRSATAPRRSPYAPAQEDPRKRGNYTAGGLYAPGVRDSVPSDGIPDIDLIPEPVVRDEPHSRYGNRSPYQVLGKTYRVRESAAGYDETGLASYYGNKFHGRRTSNLEVYDMYAFTAAHKTLPLPSYARVTNLANGKSVVVRVNDRGPFHDGRIIDLSFAAAVKLGIDRAGTGRVEVRGLSPGENAREPYDAVATAPATGLPPGVHIATGRPQPAPPSPIDQLVAALPSPAATPVAAPTTALVPVAAMDNAAAAGNVIPTSDGRDWRFDMSQDGRTMTADEFDAWMRARQARVATGKPGVPRQAPAGPEAPPATRASASATSTPVPPAAPPPTAPAEADAVVLQVASFSAQDNAERALSMLAGAGIAGARLQDADANGRHVWRLRVGPVAAAAETELVDRLAGLGFGPPQRVRE